MVNAEKPPSRQESPTLLSPTHAVVESDNDLGGSSYNQVQFGLSGPASKGFQRFSIFSVLYTVLVILWGAVVRATGSGAGCGDHWPKCDGEVIPTSMDFAKAVEFTHRAMSGIWILIIGALAIWAVRTLPKGHLVRKGCRISVIFGIIECLLGAALVRFALVADNTSSARALVMALHHTNTTILLGTITLTAYWAFGGKPLQIRGQGAVVGSMVVGIVAMIATIVSGAMTALGDTLFPVASSLESVQRSLDPTAHFLERFRIAHPIISVSATLFLIMGLTYIATSRSTAPIKKLNGWLVSALVAQIILGLINVALKAPIWMQVVHLAVADIIWIGMVVFFAMALAPGLLQPRESVEPQAPAPKMTGRETMKAYIALTKPRIISLLLFTTLVAMFIAARGWPGGWLLFWVAIGGYFAAGAANAINMVIDRDIDNRMERTSKRPTVTNAIPPLHALTFALTLAGASFAILTLAANVLSAMMAMAGLLFYVIIYTMLLKRRTWQNIVIGGAAGSFPPLVGWAAVTGELSPFAWFLFGLIFLWTPVHFWALALMIKDEYANAGIPMLPVVHGDRATVVQISAYAVLTAILCAAPVMLGQAGAIYIVAAVLLNGLLVLRSWQLMVAPDRPKAVRLFKYSMVYLALIFVVMAVDRAGGGPNLPL